MKIDVLDYGYIKFIESWGGGEAKIPEAGIIEAARQSTQGTFRGWETDEKLLAYLYKHKHNTPFEFCGMTLEVQLPIMVVREWQRHRTFSYNEMSARYEKIPALFYVPSLERVMMNANGNNKQAGTIKGADKLTEENARQWLDTTRGSYSETSNVYEHALMQGIPKEIARLTMPVGQYTRMRVTGNLRNWLAFLTLRLDPAAQWEIRQYAEGVASIVANEFPRTFKQFRLSADT